MPPHMDWISLSLKSWLEISLAINRDFTVHNKSLHHYCRVRSPDGKGQIQLLTAKLNRKEVKVLDASVLPCFPWLVGECLRVRWY